MSSKLTLLLVSVLTLGVTGCGTITNLAVDVHDNPLMQRVYGGVRADAQFVAEYADLSTAETLTQRCQWCGWALLVSLDVPFSAVGDTLTLPWILSVRAQHPDWVQYQKLELTESGEQASTRDPAARIKSD